MKKTLIALALLVAVPSAMAGFGPNSDGSGPGKMRGPNVERMAVMLDMSPEQQAQVKALFAEQAQKRQETRAAMRAEMQEKMNAILTPEQVEKMGKLRGQGMASRDMGGMGKGGRGACDRSGQGRPR